jgi:hypothetical protein
MRLVFVNHAHPESGHVSGMRLGNFATAMAARGHQVVLLTCALPDSKDAGDTLADVTKRLRTHAWATPLVVAVQPHRRRALELIRGNKAPALLRRALTLGQFLAHGGMFADWQVPAESVATQLAHAFRPELAWATFGDTSSLMLARSLSRHAGCPWLMDVKDNWTAFIPAGLRRLTAWRVRDAAGWTSNSVAYQRIASKWLRPIRQQVVYSGVADPFLARAPAAEHRTDKRELLLVGSTRAATDLQTYLAAVAEWANELPATARARLRFVYAGSNHRQVAEALRTTPLPCETRVLHQLTLAELAAHLHRAFANSYIVCGNGGFHHKLLELLAAGRPLVCFPAETAESLQLSAQSSTPLASCQSGAELQAALATAWVHAADVSPATATPAWRWADFAVELERFFQSILRNPGQ